MLFLMRLLEDTEESYKEPNDHKSNVKITLSKKCFIYRYQKISKINYFI